MLERIRTKLTEEWSPVGGAEEYKIIDENEEIKKMLLNIRLFAFTGRNGMVILTVFDFLTVFLTNEDLLVNI